jgi:hypothetical protein
MVQHHEKTVAIADTGGIHSGWPKGRVCPGLIRKINNLPLFSI